MNEIQDHVFIIEGSEDVIVLMQEALIGFGMVLPETTISPALTEEVSMSSLSYGQDSFLDDRNADSTERYAFDSDVLSMLAVTLISSGVLSTLISTLLAKSEFNLEVTSSGNISKVSFKNVRPSEIPKIIQDISKAIKESKVVNL